MDVIQQVQKVCLYIHVHILSHYSFLINIQRFTYLQEFFTNCILYETRVTLGAQQSDSVCTEISNRT